MRPFGSPKELEKRRREAMTLLDLGFSLHQVGRMLQCDARSVMRWRNARQAEGDKGLSPKPAPGPSKLTGQQKDRLVSLLLMGAMANGYPTELWTTARIAELIHHTFGIRYHSDHIGRLMASLQWIYQKPTKPVPERNEEIIAEGTEKTLHGWVPMSSSLIVFILPSS